MTDSRDSRRWRTHRSAGIALTVAVAGVMGGSGSIAPPAPAHSVVVDAVQAEPDTIDGVPVTPAMYASVRRAAAGLLPRGAATGTGPDGWPANVNRVSAVVLPRAEALGPLCPVGEPADFLTEAVLLFHLAGVFEDTSWWRGERRGRVASARAAVVLNIRTGRVEGVRTWVVRSPDADTTTAILRRPVSRARAPEVRGHRLVFEPGPHQVLLRWGKGGWIRTAELPDQAASVRVRAGRYRMMVLPETGEPGSLSAPVRVPGRTRA